MSKRIEQPSLFDEPALVEAPTESTWQEAPQLVFESWSQARQLDYCARRDDDSAIHTDNDEWIIFFGRRAERYRAELALLLAAKSGGEACPIPLSVQDGRLVPGTDAPLSAK